MLESTQNVSLHATSQLDRIAIWIHKHPTTMKIVKMAGLILGLGLLVSIPFTAPLIATGFVVGIAITGALLTAAASAAIFALDILAPPHHNMKNHVYKEGKCEGGRLYYEGDVPVLSIDSDDPFKAGKAQGYLCGDAINRLSKRFDLVLHTLSKKPRAHQIPNTLAAIRKAIPPEYLREIEGLVEGYNQWIKEQYGWQFPKKLTVDDALLFHLIPDSLHFQAEKFEPRSVAAKPNNKIAFACSAIVNRDPQKGFIFARNMDWPSFGLAGAYTLVINRKHTNGLCSTAEVGVPGFVGTLTGMNDQGLAVAMNVCSGNTQQIRGMPASIYNRACLEKCRTVQEAEEFTRNHSPLGAYHMTVVDQKQAESIHFYQSDENTHLIRRWEETRPLTTLNCRYNPQPSCHMHYSIERQKLINTFFQNKKNRPLEDVLSLPYVNNWITTHRVVMEPQTGTFKVAFDNAFAGRIPLHAVPVQRLFHKD